eukprot:TRINITY_DN67106_c2_g1_i10.p1 TRINITY_DN67106_c2_g1~~TRINITY_DN67106_c2_g1_i10.p1  ORF type:complete len:145 (+),score=15.08 TRINITY_DN67106_c2_g1_i10:1451-1885(+)
MMMMMPNRSGPEGREGAKPEPDCTEGIRLSDSHETINSTTLNIDPFQNNNSDPMQGDDPSTIDCPLQGQRDASSSCACGANVGFPCIKCSLDKHSPGCQHSIKKNGENALLWCTFVVGVFLIFPTSLFRCQTWLNLVQLLARVA